MALQLDSLSARLAGDPELAARAERLRDQMRRTVAEVRRAVDDLRPPALDQLGLAGALREQLAGVAQPGWVDAAGAASCRRCRRRSRWRPTGSPARR